MASLDINRLLLDVADDAKHANVLTYLASHPDIASEADVNGYSLLHAACSYGRMDLMDALVHQYKVDPNIKDEEGDTPLFFAETTDAIDKMMELGANLDWKNDDDQTFLNKLEEESEYDPSYRALLEYVQLKPWTQSGSKKEASDVSGPSTSDSALPPLPEGLNINIGVTVEDETMPIDPVFKQRIQELVDSADYNSAEKQAELKELVSDVLKNMDINHDNERETKRS